MNIDSIRSIYKKDINLRPLKAGAFIQFEERRKQIVELASKSPVDTEFLSNKFNACKAAILVDINYLIKTKQVKDISTSLRKKLIVAI